MKALRVLIVEDARDTADLLAFAVRSAGQDVHVSLCRMPEPKLCVPALRRLCDLAKQFVKYGFAGFMLRHDHFHLAKQFHPHCGKPSLPFAEWDDSRDE